MKKIRISQDLFTKIKMDRQLTLSIHSVYCDVINTVDSDSRLISILNHNKKLVPMGILIDNGLEFQGLKKYTQIKLGFTKGSTICLNGQLEVSDLYLYSCPHNINKLIAAEQILKKFLETHAPKDSFYKVIQQLMAPNEINSHQTEDNRMSSVIIPKMKTYLQALYQHRSIDSHVNVLGFGIGLTPSSDDFIVGISSVLQYAGDIRLHEMKAHGEKFLHTTTFVSAQMLSNAWDGQYTMYLHQLFQAIGTDRLSEEILVDTVSYGHTSGIDTLCGIIMGLEMLKTQIGTKDGAVEK